MLTSKEKNVLNFIERYYFRLQSMPTVFDIRNALNFPTDRQVIMVVKSLIAKQALPQISHDENTHQEDDSIMQYMEKTEETVKSFPKHAVAKNCLKNHLVKKQSTCSSANDEDYAQIVHLGNIAAGTPIESFQNMHNNQVTLPISMLGTGKEHYALTVRGDSMVEAGINDGDMVIIERCREAENGDVIVALVDGEEVTLKTLRKINNRSIALEPANPDYETRIYGPARVSIQGKLVSLMRKF